MYNVIKLIWKWYALALVVIIFDQLTKLWAVSAFEYGVVDRVTSFFYLTQRHNYGAAFSLFAQGSGWQRLFLGGIAAIVSVLLALWIARLKNSNWIESCALALIMGGALGNLVDRVYLGYVVDFIALHYQRYEWPAFNVADSSICIGAALMLWGSFFAKKTVAQEGEKGE